MGICDRIKLRIRMLWWFYEKGVHINRSLRCHCYSSHYSFTCFSYLYSSKSKNKCDIYATSHTCSEGKLLLYNNEYKCAVTEIGCPSGYTLENNKCYGPWSAWSTTVYTPSSTMEVLTRTK